MKLVDAVEYLVLIAFIYTFIYGPAEGGKQLVVISATLGFFMLSGTSWLLSSGSPAAREYKEFSLPLLLVAVLIGLATLAYVWLM